MYPTITRMSLFSFFSKHKNTKRKTKQNETKLLFSSSKKLLQILLDISRTLIGLHFNPWWPFTEASEWEIFIWLHWLRLSLGYGCSQSHPYHMGLRMRFEMQEEWFTLRKINVNGSRVWAKQHIHSTYRFLIPKIPFSS